MKGLFKPRWLAFWTLLLLPALGAAQTGQQAVPSGWKTLTLELKNERAAFKKQMTLARQDFNTAQKAKWQAFLAGLKAKRQAYRGKGPARKKKPTAPKS